MARRRRSRVSSKSEMRGAAIVIGGTLLLIFSCLSNLAGGGRPSGSTYSAPNAAAQSSRSTSTPRPARTAVPTRPPRPTATVPAPPVGEAAVVANLRSEPGTDGTTVLAKLCPGDKLEYLTEQRVGVDTWYRVRVTSIGDDCGTQRATWGAEGWAAASVVGEPSGNVGQYVRSIGERVPTAVLVRAPTAAPRPALRPQAPAAPAAPSGGRVGAVCRDGSRSSATGRGACSHHGGVAQWLYR